MLLYKGEKRAKRGIYWEVGHIRGVDLSEEGILPGNAAAMFLRIPTFALLAAGAFVGLLYVILLPFAWIVASVFIIVKQLAGNLVSATNLSFGWRPVEAYLAGRRKKKAEKKNRA